jgi:hypothetical protein
VHAALRLVEERTEELIRETIDRAAAAILGWRGLEVDGAPFPFTPDNARRLGAARSPR